jgi:hypothetical protein
MLNYEPVPTIEWCILHERHEPIPSCVTDNDYYECISDLKQQQKEDEEAK